MRVKNVSFNLIFVLLVYNVDSDNCANDKLRISSKGGQVKTTCGTGSPRSAVFEGNEVYIEFTTNEANNNFGFMLTYKLINMSAALPQGTWEQLISEFWRF